MIWEWWNYLRTPCDPWAHEIGYLYESIATGARHRRCREAWQSHLDHTRHFIRDSVHQTKKNSNILIVGSGWLFDIPLEEIAREFREVTLLDVVHPYSTISFARKFGNVRLLRGDVTGWARKLVGTRKASEITPPPDMPKIEGCGERYDFVVSANILSQLGVMPLRWVRRNFPEIDDEQIDSFEEKIERVHLQFLEVIGENRCLITDVLSKSYNATDKLVNDEPLLMEIPLPVPSENWQWEIMPLGERGDTRTVHEVVAFQF